MKNSRRLGVFVALCTAVPAIAACGGGGSGADSGGKKGDATVVVAVNSLPDNLVSMPWEGDATQTVLSGLASQLATYTDVSCDQPPSDTDIGGKLAESLTMDPDRKAVTVKLRPLKSPEGNTLSGEDVEWSFKRNIALDPFAADNLEQAGYDIKNPVTVVDESTVKLNINSSTPASYVLESLYNSIVNIYDSKTVKEHATTADPWGDKWLATNIADYSGWTMESFTPMESLTLTATPDWGGERGNVKRLVIQAVPDPATRQQLLTSGSAQVAVGLDYSQYEKLKSDDSVSVVGCRGLGQDLLIFQTQKPPFDDVRVRQAISMAIDRETLTTSAYAGLADAATSAFSSAYDFETDHPYTYDVAKAKSLLAEAGVAEGTTVTLTYTPTSPGPVVNRIAVQLQSALDAIGLKLKLERVQNPSDFQERFYGHQFEMVVRHNLPPFTDAAFNVYVQFTKGGPENTSQFHDPDFDALQVKHQATPVEDAAARRELLSQMASIADEQSPQISLVEPLSVYASSTAVAPLVPQIAGTLQWTDISVK